MSAGTAASPWQEVLGDDFARLAPGLRDYFGPVPEDAVGRGSGVFERVGTPRRWLWPALAVAGAVRIVWPRWEQHVPFAVENRREHATLLGRRTFRFRGGERTMVDAVTAEDGAIVDRLGRGGVLRCRFRATVDDEGALALDAVRVRLLGVPLPARVRLRERSLPAGRQRVEFVLDVPGIGRVYEYAGEFAYRIAPAAPP